MSMIKVRTHNIECAAVKVAREQRQRREVNTTDLEDSIKRLGLINPIVVDEELNLIAGERRLLAHKNLGLATIAARFIGDLDTIDRQLIELEENVKRLDLPWMDRCEALARIHALYCERDPTWNQGRTAEATGYAPGHVSDMLRVFEDKSHPLVQKATNIRAARNILTRIDQRRRDTVLASISEAAARVVGAEPKPQEPDSILNLDFLEWAPQYEGPRFNFIHCDFPYGIEFNQGPQGGSHKDMRYDDSPDTYWNLVESLCANLDRLMSTSAHLMFWFSMEHYTETLARFRALAPSLIFNPFPLIWTKSDNVGILADPKRRPRNTYETCFIASREDRLLVRAVANFYSAPTDKTYHPSTKPEPMLRFFMQMFVDDTTRMLDPTCGSGAALRAAESLGAKQVLGLEVDQEYCNSAIGALKRFRTLRRLADVTPKPQEQAHDPA